MLINESIRNINKRNDNGITLKNYRKFIFQNVEHLFKEFVVYVDYCWENNIDFYIVRKEILNRSENMDELNKAIKLLEANGYVVTKPLINEMTSQRGFIPHKVYKVKQGRKTYDAVYLVGANGRFTFIMGDNLLDSDYPFTVDGKPMVIVTTRECANPKWMKLWNTATNKTAKIHERIVFKFPEENKKKTK